MRLRAGARWQTGVVTAGSGFRSSSSKVLHFGLGPAERADEVAIRWPSGHVTRLAGLAAGRRYEVHEGRDVATPILVR